MSIPGISSDNRPIYEANSQVNSGESLSSVSKQQSNWKQVMDLKNNPVGQQYIKKAEQIAGNQHLTKSEKNEYMKALLDQIVEELEEEAEVEKEDDEEGVEKTDEDERIEDEIDDQIEDLEITKQKILEAATQLKNKQQIQQPPRPFGM